MLANKKQSTQETNDQKIVLNSLLYGAFFRKTSKLGLEFAREQSIPVCFVWRLPDFSQLDSPNDSPKLTTLEDLYQYLGKKSYRSFKFTEDDHGVKYMEAITSSEMRYLSRLQASGLLKMERIAPNYLLIREIKLPSSSDSKEKWNTLI